MSAHSILQPGSECYIRSLGSDKKIAQRLVQMGVLPGSILRVIRLAPFGETVEVSIDQGQYLALRAGEINAMDCKIIAMPLSANAVQSGQNYRIRSLFGGKTFQQKMKHQGIIPGGIIQVHKSSGFPIQIELIPDGKYVVMGQGEAEKVIIEVLDDPEK